ncbi:MAG: phosphatidylserine/phosphatidylglycerophosphate/cardiolipin synthase family protein [Sandaracinaceae bacterium]
MTTELQPTSELRALELLLPRRASDDAPESVRLLDGGELAYPSMLDAIERARDRIHLEVYAFARDGIGARFVDALIRASGRGVSVIVRLDGVGSARDGRSVVATLRASGANATIHNPLRSLLVGRWGRNHRKLLLVDDEVAFLGGINIGDENVGEGTRLGWADLALEIRGPACARLGSAIRGEPPPAKQGSLRIALSRRGGGWRLRRTYLEAFDRARTRIHVAHGYFLPDGGIVRALTRAARRGVDVRLLLAGESDVPLARAATRSLYRRLIASGVQIHEWTGSVLHAKVTTIDGAQLLVGSFNLDPFSLANLEALVSVDDPTVVSQAEDWIQHRFASSRVVTSVEAGTWTRRWILDPMGRVIAGVVATLGRWIAGSRGSPPWPTRRRRQRTDAR